MEYNYIILTETWGVQLAMKIVFLLFIFINVKSF